MRERIIGFVAHIFFLLLFFLWTMNALFLLEGMLLYVEIIVFCGLLASAAIGISTYLRNKNYVPLRIVYILGLLSTAVLSYLVGEYLWYTAAAAVAGLFASAYERQERARKAVSDVLVTEIPTEKQKSIRRKSRTNVRKK
ncbi:MAG TPA: hypothetical protein VJB66_03485 [Candidatus Nanoarchaeia archaeon]|nr:hypothetical protein [Candidatus Nanoarchaeia archaeon]